MKRVRMKGRRKEGNKRERVESGKAEEEKICREGKRRGAEMGDEIYLEKSEEGEMKARWKTTFVMVWL